MQFAHFSQPFVKILQKNNMLEKPTIRRTIHNLQIYKKQKINETSLPTLIHCSRSYLKN